MALPARRLGSASSTETIATVLGGFSLEATFPKPAEIDALKRTAPAGTRVYLSCLPNRSPEKLVEYAANVRNAGFEAVPHLAARAYENRAMVDRLLSRAVLLFRNRGRNCRLRLCVPGASGGRDDGRQQGQPDL